METGLEACGQFRLILHPSGDFVLTAPARPAVRRYLARGRVR